MILPPLLSKENLNFPSEAVDHGDNLVQQTHRCSPPSSLDPRVSACKRGCMVPPYWSPVYSTSTANCSRFSLHAQACGMYSSWVPSASNWISCCGSSLSCSSTGLTCTLDVWWTCWHSFHTLLTKFCTRLVIVLFSQVLPVTEALTPCLSAALILHLPSMQVVGDHDDNLDPDRGHLGIPTF